MMKIEKDLEEIKDNDLIEPIAKKLIENSKIDPTLNIRKISTTRKYYHEELFLYRKVVDGTLQSQLWKFERSFDGLKENLKYWLLNFEIFDKKIYQVSKASTRSKVRSGLTYAIGDGYAMTTSFYGDPSVFPNDWVEKLDQTEFKYVSESIRNYRIHPDLLERIHKYRVQLEYCKNINNKRLHDQILRNYEVDMRVVNLKWLINNKQILRNSNHGYLEVDLQHKINIRGKYVPGIEEYLHPQHIKKIPTEIGIVSFQNWVIKNKVKVDYYFDYLSLLEELGVNDKSKNTLLPKNVKESHDLAVEQLNLIAKERAMKLEAELEEQYKKTKAANKELVHTGKEYSILLPETITQIIEEGKTLNHCVGGRHYIDGHTKGELTILFVRSNKELEKPLYTIEIKNGVLKQIRGKHNRGPTSDVIEFVNIWKAKKLKKKQGGIRNEQS